MSQLQYDYTAEFNNFLQELPDLGTEPVYPGGAFSDVYEREWLTEPIALKTSKIDGANEASAHMHKKLSREVEIWKGLEHPNITKVLTTRFDLSSTRLDMVTPWMANGNIAEYLTKYPDTNRRVLVEQIAAGMDYLHSKDVVHGDLKAANVLIDTGGRAVLADFGLASSTLRKELQSVDAAGKSWRYMAPELLDPRLSDAGLEPTTASDVYSFASVCYEVLTGNRPFNHITSDVEVLLAVHDHQHPFRPPVGHASTARGLDDAMWELILSCWKPLPADRPTMSAIYKQLIRKPSTQAEQTEANCEDDNTSSLSTSNDLTGGAGFHRGNSRVKDDLAGWKAISHL